MNPIVQAALQNISKRYQNQVRMNDMLRNTRVAGKYSPEGLDNAQAQSELDASDRIRAKQMIGLAGSMVQ